MRSSSSPILTAIASGVVILLLVLAALAVSLGAPSAEGAGAATGRMLVTLAPAVAVAAWLAKRSKAGWPTWKIAATVLVIFAAITVLTSLGRLGA